MAEKRILTCDIPGCGFEQSEPNYGDGWAGWSTLQGISLNCVDNPFLCPDHTKQIADFIDSLGCK